MQTMMRVLGFVAVCLISGQAMADEVSHHRQDRALAGEKDFSKEYLEKITDEKGIEEARREELRQEHDKYMRSMGREK